jgi:acetyl esterase/lipase
MLIGAAISVGLTPSSAQSPSAVVVDADGTVHVPAITVPVSSYLSDEGKAYLAEHLLNMQRPPEAGADSGVPSLIAPYLERQKEIYQVEREDTSIAGVHAYVYTPADGISEQNQNRVLINLHGGGFMGCWPGCAELESIPISALGRIKVVAVDYRQGPDHRFPAASEDVAAVYAELLKTYPAENIGIYGCSAGGMLTGMALAWFQAHDLPSPGAAGILCAGVTTGDLAFGGDANYTTMPLGEARMPPSPGPAGGSLQMPYLAGTDPNDPLVAPGASLDVLAQFPPTLVVTGTRGFELSAAVHAHALLVKAGAEADLHVWEGMFHGFFYNPDVPESQDCYDVIVKFFDKHLGA